MIHQVESVEEFNQLINTTKYKATIVDFTATWCPPCRAIAPYYEELSSKYTDIQFLKVDVDGLKEIARKASIFAMPTFIIYKNGKKTNISQRGANKDGLRKLLESVSTSFKTEQQSQELSLPSSSKNEKPANDSSFNEKGTPDNDTKETNSENEKKSKKRTCCLIC